MQVPAMRSDRAKVKKILASLLGNACKFTEKGEIVASIDIADGRVVYRVRDTDGDDKYDKVELPVTIEIDPRCAG